MHSSDLSQARYVLLILLSSFFIYGCGLKTEHIHVDYYPQGTAEKITGANGVGVRVDISDLRDKKQEVSKKGDEYEMLAPILAENDVAEVLKKAVRSELKRRGFNVEGKDIQILLELSKFYNRFRSDTSEAELFMHVQVKDPEGVLKYASIIHGVGIERGVALRSGANAKAALDAALRDTVYKLMTEADFIKALIAVDR